MCKYCNGEIELYEETGSYIKINKNENIGKYLEFSDEINNVMCVKINFCPVCGDKL